MRTRNKISQMAAVDVSDAGTGVDVLILGGCGFVGRHLVEHLVKAGGVRVRVVDKVMPAMAFLAPEHKVAFEASAVEYVQADLSRQTGVEKAFDGRDFRYVFNLTYDAVTFGSSDEVYQQRVVDVSTRAGMLAAQKGVARFVELSTGQVYEPSEKPATESTGKLKPWTKQATYKLRAEAALRDVPNLPLTVLRCATIYGPADVYGLSPRVLCAAVYRHLNEKMKFAWDGKLKANTVHVRDVAAVRGAMTPALTLLGRRVPPSRLLHLTRALSCSHALSHLSPLGLLARRQARFHRLLHNVQPR